MNISAVNTSATALAGVVSEYSGTADPWFGTSELRAYLDSAIRPLAISPTRPSRPLHNYAYGRSRKSLRPSMPSAPSGLSADEPN